jgi:hypothetical protein
VIRDVLAYCGAVAISLLLVAGAAWVLMLAKWGEEP